MHHSVSKICSFINLCIHPSLFWVFEKTFTAFTLQAYTHFFQKLVMISEFFQRKVGSYLFSQACCFLARQLFIFYYFLFFSSFFFFSYLLYFPFPLFFFFKLFTICSFPLFFFLFFFLFFYLKRSCGRGRTLPTYV